MKALDEYFLMVVFTLLLKRVNNPACYFNLDMSKAAKKVISITL